MIKGEMIIHSIKMGWIGFVFKNESNASTILHRIWGFDKNAMVLKFWHPLFDPHNNFLDVILACVKDPCFPLEFLSKEGLKAVVDAIWWFFVVKKVILVQVETSVMDVNGSGSKSMTIWIH